MDAFARLKAFRRLGREVTLWHHPEYAPRCLLRHADVIDFAIDRGERIVRALRGEGLLERWRGLREPAPADYADLIRVHDPEYVERTQLADTGARVFGVQPEEIDADELVRSQRLQVGATVEAALELAGLGERSRPARDFARLRLRFDPRRLARRARRHLRAWRAAPARPGYRVAVNLGGGLHHAGRAMGSGFCLYNDVAAAIAALRARGFDAPLAVIDLDYHFGDGTLEIFGDDPTVLKVSVHGSAWEHLRPPAAPRSARDALLPPGTHDAPYLERLEREVLPSVRAHAPGLIFYLAGNDVLHGDRLGDFSLTPAGVLARDRRVIALARELDVPVVLTLAGGYSPLAWQCSANLIAWLLTDEARPDHRWETPLRERFGEISDALARRPRSPRGVTHVGADDDPLYRFDERDLLSTLQRTPASPRWLDLLTTESIEYALERYGILSRLRALGFHGLRVEIDRDNRERHLVRIRGHKEDLPQELLLVELAATRAALPCPPGVADPTRELRLLSVAWLLLQDPTAEFRAEKPRLPGQEHPGLGIAYEVQELLVQLARRLELDGILSVPAHYPNAAVASREFSFLEPRDQGRFLALRRALGPRPLAQASALLDRGAVRMGPAAQPMRHVPAPQVLPVSERLRAYLDSEDYREAALRESSRLLAGGLRRYES